MQLLQILSSYLVLGEAPDQNNSSVRIGLARDQVGIDLPRFRGCGQFSLYILSLWKQPNCARFQQRIGVAEQFFQRRDRTRRDDLKPELVAAGKVLDSLRVHNGRQVERVDGLAKEGGLLAGCSPPDEAARPWSRPMRRRSPVRESLRPIQGRSSAWPLAPAAAAAANRQCGASRSSGSWTARSGSSSPAAEDARHEGVEPRPCFT